MPQALKQTEVRLGVKTASSTDKIQSADPDASPTLAQTVGAYFHVPLTPQTLNPKPQYLNPDLNPKP
jgi:hypothetical protein